MTGDCRGTLGHGVSACYVGQRGIVAALHCLRTCSSGASITKKPLKYRCAIRRRFVTNTCEQWKGLGA